MADPTGKETVEPGMNEKTSQSSENGDELKKLDSKIAIPDKQEDDFEAALNELPEHEREIIRKQTEFITKPISYFTLYRYANVKDRVIIAISGICAIGAGAVMPVMTVIFGDLTGVFAELFTGEISGDAFMDEVSGFTLKFVYLFIGLFCGSYIANVGFLYTGEHVTQRIREEYLRSILRQNQAFFDKLGAGEVTVRITTDTNLVQNAVSEKVGMTLMASAAFISAYVIGFITSWKLTLILTSTVVAMGAIMGVGSTFIIKYFGLAFESYGKGGTVSEEVFSSIRNAVAFGTEEKLAKNYEVHLITAEKYGRTAKISIGITIGCIMGTVYLNFGLAFWQGSEFVLRGDALVGDIITTLLALMIGAFSLSGVAPNISHFQNGTSAGAKIFSTIDRVSTLDPTSPDGDKLDSVQGTIELRDIKFIYPSRPDVLVLPKMNLVVPAGKVTALVGPSGSGKSTIVGLVERFYDPVGGSVLLDGRDVKDLNLRWLREQVSLVGQEPILFSVTIFDNVCHGLIGTKYENADEATKKELVVNACQMSNADGFINELPEGYDTNVGQRGFLLSGGQKQRIAIARAIVSDPKILLLDEATSALDTRSEGIVQEALDRASKSRTTIVIAHRLSTIRNADNIVVMSKGEIVEQGTHDDLMAQKGEYFRLVEAQRITRREAADDSDDDESTIGGTTESGVPEVTNTMLPIVEDRPLQLARTTTGKHSLASIALAKQEEEKKKKHSVWSLFRMINRFNRQEKNLLLFATFCCIILGGGSPVQAVFFSKSIIALSLPPEYHEKMKKDASFWSLMFLMLGLIQIIVGSISAACFGVAAEKLIRRVRDTSFRTLLRQEMGYFDDEAHSTGVLTTFLSTEAIDIAGLSGTTFSTILSACVTVVASVAISIAVSWKLGLVCTACVPFLVGAGFFRLFLLNRYEQKKRVTYEKSASFASEATAAIKTVTSLTRDIDVWTYYHDMLEAQTIRGLKSSFRSSILYALSESVVVLIVALGFWYGGKLMSEGGITVEKFFLAFTTVLFGAQSAGSVFSFAADMGKARNAAIQVKDLIERKPVIDTWSKEGERLPTVEGKIEFRDVHFRYPTRPHVPVLRGLNLTVQPGQYVALVGPSGCGKSTTIGLLERFYDSLSGEVLVDGKDITKLNLVDYRTHLALVSQEPTLYQGTIKENILLGLGGMEDVPDAEIFEACRQANIHDFIMSLPEGYNTDVGNKGGMLSGGQKQRVAIARALIRKPKILLLDEATSALDSESEKVVQDALDVAAHGRTTIAIAHRLSTIQKADVIYVFENGRITEKGTHQELLALQGRYSDLVKLQSVEEA